MFLGGTDGGVTLEVFLGGTDGGVLTVEVAGDELSWEDNNITFSS